MNGNVRKKFKGHVEEPKKFSLEVCSEGVYVYGWYVNVFMVCFLSEVGCTGMERRNVNLILEM